MALAGTLGVGNIAGVALAVAAGGAGAVFWMWVSAAVSMFLKYGEIVLAFRFRPKEKSTAGGAMYYMRDGIGGKAGGAMAKLFSLLCLLSACTLGGAVQSSAMAECLSAAFSFPAWFSGALLAGATALVVFGGVRKIHKLTAKLIPVLTLFYFLLALFACIKHASGLPHVLKSKFSEAFSPLSGVAGVGGFFTARAVRYGVTRGLLSNEAGAGTAPMAHATAENNATAQGVMGIAEVFIDTFVLCTATAFAVLLAFPSPSAEMGGVTLVLRAFSLLVGDFTALPLILSVVLFVYATAVCWCYYGESAVGYLLPGNRAKWVYLFSFLLFLTVGAVISDGLVWHITDIAVSLMTLLNLVALLVLLPHVVRGDGAFGRNRK